MGDTVRPESIRGNELFERQQQNSANESNNAPIITTNIKFKEENVFYPGETAKDILNTEQYHKMLLRQTNNNNNIFEITE